MGCDLVTFEVSKLLKSFLLTHPVWDVTSCCYGARFWLKFLLTHPVWDVTLINCSSKLSINISTHTSRVGCDICVCGQRRCCDIFTHTSRVGCDCSRYRAFTATANFYSHIPCGMWLGIHRMCNPLRIFLLTHPVWDVTLYIVYFNHIIPIYYRMDL